MNQWLHQHRLALAGVIARMRRSLSQTIMMGMMMGVTLALPAMLYVIVDNLRTLAGEVRSESKISVFLATEITAVAIEALKERLEKEESVKSFEYASKSEAWKRFKESQDTAEITAHLENNPLPDAFFVQPKVNDAESVNQLRDTLQKWEGVALAQVDANWLQRLGSILQIANKAALILSLLLGFAIAVIIGNSIRLQILTQRDEIEVSKLIGATDTFIRRPFLYSGAIYGLIGGIAAWGILVAVIAIFNHSIATLSSLYASDFRLAMPHLVVGVTLMISATSLGWLGAHFAVNRSIAKLQAH